MKPATLPIIALIGAPEDKESIGDFNTHTYQLKATEWNKWKGYDFRYLNLGSEAGTDAAQEAETLLNQCALVIVFLSVDVMANDALYSLVGRALELSKQRGFKSVGIQLRADLGCERDLWKRISYILIHEDKPISEHRGAAKDGAWVAIIGKLRRYLPPM